MRPVSELQRKVAPFQVVSDYVPAGDQPAAIEEIARRINGGVTDVVLLGATGTGLCVDISYRGDPTLSAREQLHRDQQLLTEGCSSLSLKGTPIQVR